MRQCYLFDIDGTLSIPTDRMQFLEVLPKNWDAFLTAAGLDVINFPVVHLYQSLARLKELDDNPFDLFITTARGEREKPITEAWLAKQGIVYDRLYMRGMVDYRADWIVKEEYVRHIRESHEIIGVFDDRAGVLRQFIDMDVFAFDVSQNPREESALV